MGIQEEKTVVITGTSRGIGLKVCQRFLEIGYGVLGISRSITPIVHRRFSQLRADLQRPGDIRGLRTEILKHPIVGLINNAGVLGPLGPFESNDLTSWVNTFQVNLFSAAELTQICVPRLRENGGFIIFFSGGGSAFPRPNFSAYGVSKTAIVRFSEVLARELAPDVLVYCVAPGPNQTVLLDEAIRAGTRVPPEELVDFSCPVRLCEFLAQNRDRRYSGKFIHVKDNYSDWVREEMSEDAYTLRRVKI